MDELAIVSPRPLLSVVAVRVEGVWVEFVMVGSVVAVGVVTMGVGTREAKVCATLVVWAAGRGSAAGGAGLFTTAADEAPESTSGRGRGGAVLDATLRAGVLRPKDAES